MTPRKLVVLARLIQYGVKKWDILFAHLICCGEDLERFYVPRLKDHEWKLNFDVKKSKLKKCEVVHPQTIINLGTERLLLYWIESKREFFDC